MSEPLLDNGWLIGFAGSTITGVSYMIIAALVMRGLGPLKAWRQSPLAVGTFFIFFSCGIGHLIHSIQLMYPLLGVAEPLASAQRIHYNEWHLWVGDGLTAAAGVTYITLRKRFPDLVRGAALYEDLTRRNQQAMAMHDNVVQRLVRAKWHLDVGNNTGAEAALDEVVAETESMLAKMALQANETQAIAEDS